MSEYFPKVKPSGWNLKFVLDLSYHATTNLKNATVLVHQSLLLVTLKSKVNKLEIGYLKATPFDLKMKLLKRLYMMSCLKTLILFRIATAGI